MQTTRLQPGHAIQIGRYRLVIDGRTVSVEAIDHTSFGLRRMGETVYVTRERDISPHALAGELEAQSAD